MSRFTFILIVLWATPAVAADRPNVLWLTNEDMGPHLGCYGDKVATTPNIDKLAAKGLRYTTCWSNAPVCAPARSTLISGMYPTSTGAEHMRSLVSMPKDARMYPQYLRDAGYYCTNNSKEDYNLAKPGKVWDDSSNKAHYKNRKDGQPFFAVFNYTITHESQVRTRPHMAVHDPAKVRVPGYHPDAPEVRQDWAQYHDKITEMDALVGKALEELDKAGLADDTIVFYYSDHGPGLPRCKRTPCDSGLHVPFIVHFPAKWKHLAPPDYKAGGSTDRLVSFVDMAPTLLSLADVKPPRQMQGVPFLGKHIGESRQYVHGFRGRMDERIDCVRSVRDKRYVYVRNFMPHLPAGQHVAYLFQTPTTQVWKKLFDQGKLNDAQSIYWKPKAPEELYDLETDPDEVKNLAASPDHKKVLARMREEMKAQVMRVRDVGLLPEDEMHRRAKGTTPYDFGHDEKKYPLDRVFAAADRAAAFEPDDVPGLMKLLTDDDAGVRYWAVMGLLIRGPKAVGGAKEALWRRLEDTAPSVRVAAAEALGRFGDKDDLKRALSLLLEHASPVKHGAYAAVQALNALDALGDKAALLSADIGKLPETDPDAPQRANGYVTRLVKDLTAKLDKAGKP